MNKCWHYSFFSKKSKEKIATKQILQKILTTKIVSGHAATDATGRIRSLIYLFCCCCKNRKKNKQNYKKVSNLNLFYQNYTFLFRTLLLATLCCMTYILIFISIFRLFIFSPKGSWFSKHKKKLPSFKSVISKLENKIKRVICIQIPPFSLLFPYVTSKNS